MNPNTASAFLRTLFDIAVAAADPVHVLPRHLGTRPSGRVVLLGAGKASARMAEAVENAWGKCEGIVVTRYGHARQCQGVEVIEAAHPIPDTAGINATWKIMELAKSLGKEDTAIALISGGGSSLLCAPHPGLTLMDKQAVHRALLLSGAPIGKMNTVRKHLSAVKGGRLATMVFPARLLTFLMSDVPGDDPSEIASGPSVGDTTKPVQARSIVSDYGLELPTNALSVLNMPSTVIHPDDERLSRAESHVVAAPSQSLRSAANRAYAAELMVHILGDAIEGEACILGQAHAREALARQANMRPGDPPLLLLSSGECTVTGEVCGSGGPNAEYALAAATELNGAPGIYLISCDTDGVDGSEDVAGAIVTPQTLANAASTGADARTALQYHDSHGFFKTAGGQVVTGPTLTNVNDFRAILIFSPS